MMRIALSLLLFSSIATADTSSPAAIKKDYDNLCNATERSGASKEKNGSRRAELMVKYLNSALKTPEVKAFFGNLGNLPPAEVGPALKKAASDAGYKGKCPTAECK